VCVCVCVRVCVRACVRACPHPPPLTRTQRTQARAGPREVSRIQLRSGGVLLLKGNGAAFAATASALVVAGRVRCRRRRGRDRCVDRRCERPLRVLRATQQEGRQSRRVVPETLVLQACESRYPPKNDITSDWRTRSE
jgi:hypothetical protein